MTQYRWGMAVQMAVYRTTERDITVSNPRQTIKLGFLKCRSQDPRAASFPIKEHCSFEINQDR